MKSDPRLTNKLIHDTIERVGIRAVRDTIYGGAKDYNEPIALSNFVNSRMHADDIINELKRL